MLCQSQPCASQARWVGPDGEVRCSMHHIQAFGHAEPLVRVEGYEPPKDAPTPEPKSEVVVDAS